MQMNGARTVATRSAKSPRPPRGVSGQNESRGLGSPGPRRAAWGLIAIGVAACLFVYIAWKLYSAS